MAKAKPPEVVSSNDDQWEVEDALRTLTRAEEIQDDPKLMAKVRKLAAEKAEDMQAIAGKVAKLVKGGRIDDKQAAKLKGEKAEVE